MPAYIITESAARDIAEIMAYLRKGSSDAPKRVREKLRQAMRLPAEFPGFGHTREDVTTLPVRFWSVYSYLIVYQPDTKPLEILRIVHGARDLPKLFRSN